MMFCSGCGNMVVDSGPKSASSFSREEIAKFCSKCGTPSEQGTNFCVSCGNSLAVSLTQESTPQPPPVEIVPQQYAPPPPSGTAQQKSKMVAGLLGIFLGVFGAGRFYLGYTGLGVAQLLVSLFTSGIGAAWGFIDGIMILAGSVKTDAKGVLLK